MGRGYFGHKGWGRRGRRGQCRAEEPDTGEGLRLCAACTVADSLNDCAPGTTCRILRLMGCGAIRQRLLDLGIRPAREVTVVRNAPLNDPIELRVGDSFIVLRRREAAQIEVEHV
ncbi:ferrous iron transport protein A [Rhodovulum bhavnagarense]|uniref:Ferrous iron transport protein A n=1 Tax=Rhodovulum bhavnagarense TaxID=992286 RepID=A0A4R2R739_9RHOB|nr:FeoA family protein [Rhodovulum bhavnagarense]TCP58413.1 ferrous iron transport protein A [Rhodovulum bhavnagarense]